MKKYFNFSISCLLVAFLLSGCEKEGSVGPQGPQGPAGNPGELTGGGAAADVRAYIYNKPLSWKYRGDEFYATAYLVPASFDDVPYAHRFKISEDSVLEQDVILYYLELSGPGSLWAQLPYSFQPTATAPVQTYRAIEGYEDSREWTFRVAADLDRVTPHYTVKSLRVIVIPASNGGIVGGRNAGSGQKISLAEAMKKFNLEESDFTIME